MLKTVLLLSILSLSSAFAGDTTEFRRTLTVENQEYLDSLGRSVLSEFNSSLDNFREAENRAFEEVSKGFEGVNKEKCIYDEAHRFINTAECSTIHSTFEYLSQEYRNELGASGDLFMAKLLELWQEKEKLLQSKIRTGLIKRFKDLLSESNDFELNRVNLVNETGDLRFYLKALGASEGTTYLVVVSGSKQGFSIPESIDDVHIRFNQLLGFNRKGPTHYQFPVNYSDFNRKILVQTLSEMVSDLTDLSMYLEGDEFDSLWNSFVGNAVEHYKTKQSEISIMSSLGPVDYVKFIMSENK